MKQLFLTCVLAALITVGFFLLMLALVNPFHGHN